MEKILKVKWQRLLHEGETCPRCKSTGNEVEKAVESLKKTLLPLKIDVVLEKEAINNIQFLKDTLQSNRIWINNKPLEEYLGGQIGQSECCEVCAPHDCRTVKVGENLYETIPHDAIIKAGLIAAAELL